MSDGTRCRPGYVYGLFCDNKGKWFPLYTMCRAWMEALNVACLSSDLSRH